MIISRSKKPNPYLIDEAKQIAKTGALQIPTMIKSQIHHLMDPSKDSTQMIVSVRPAAMLSRRLQESHAYLVLLSGPKQSSVESHQLPRRTDEDYSNGQ